MKLQQILPTILVAIGASLSLNAVASGSDEATAAQVKPAEAAPAMKPHSHMQDKMGYAPEPAPTAKKVNPAQDQTKHFHPRDK